MILSTFIVAIGYAGTRQSIAGNAITKSAGLLFKTGSSTSLNWAGYAVVSGAKSVSAVTASFIVPDPVASSSSSHANSVNLQYKPGSGGGHGPGGGGSGGGSSTATYAAFWAGIDGYSSSTVEQAGILMNVSSSGTTSYAAWTEFYPAAPLYAPASFGTINTGDTITVSVVYSSQSGQMTAYVNDTTNGGTYSNHASASGYQRNSAEWIIEAPASGHSILPLADFGTVSFGSTNYANVGTSNGPIGSFTASASVTVNTINMVNRHGALKALTGGLASDQSSFTVTWESS